MVHRIIQTDIAPPVWAIVLLTPELLLHNMKFFNICEICHFVAISLLLCKLGATGFWVNDHQLRREYGNARTYQMNHLHYNFFLPPSMSFSVMSCLLGSTFALLINFHLSSAVATLRFVAVQTWLIELRNINRDINILCRLVIHWHVNNDTVCKTYQHHPREIYVSNIPILGMHSWGSMLLWWSSIWGYCNGNILWLRWRWRPHS